MQDHDPDLAGRDVSGLGAHLSGAANASRVLNSAGAVRQCGAQNVAEARITLSSHAHLGFFEDSFTVAFWAMFTSIALNNAAFTLEGTDIFVIYPNDPGGSGGVRVFWQSKGGNIIDTTGGQGLNTPAFYVFTTDQTTQRLYIDGVLEATDTDATAPTGFTNLEVGAFRSGQDYGHQIWDLTVWNRPLTQADVISLYRDPVSLYLKSERPITPIVPVAGGPIIPVFHHHYNQMKAT